MKLAVSELAALPLNARRLQCVDKQTVANYARRKTEPPPIVVDSSGQILDGLHRVAVAILQGRTEIEGEKK